MGQGVYRLTTIETRKGSISMKKMIVACFAFLFLLSLVAGCPSGGSESKPGDNSGSSSSVGEDGYSSSDQGTDDIANE